MERVEDRTEEKLEAVVENILQALRELECDHDETTNSMEFNLRYIVGQVLDTVYTTHVDEYTALGLLDEMKIDFKSLKDGSAG